MAFLNPGSIVLRSPALVVVVTAMLSSSLTSQAPGVRAGMSGGVVRLNDVRSEQVLTGVLEYDPTSWLSLSVIPVGVRVSQTLSGRSTSRTGLADLPVSAAAVYTPPSGGSPSLGVGATRGSPPWALSLGVGTAFAGTSPVLPTAPARRLQTTFGGTSGSSGTTCR